MKSSIAFANMKLPLLAGWACRSIYIRILLLSK